MWEVWIMWSNHCMAFTLNTKMFSMPRCGQLIFTNWLWYTKLKNFWSIFIVIFMIDNRNYIKFAILHCVAENAYRMASIRVQSLWWLWICKWTALVDNLFHELGHIPSMPCWHARNINTSLEHGAAPILPKCRLF